MPDIYSDLYSTSFVGVGLAVTANSDLSVNISKGWAEIVGSVGGSHQELYGGVSLPVPASSTVYLSWDGTQFYTSTNAALGWARIPLATVVTSGSAVTSVLDTRPTVSPAVKSSASHLTLPDGWDAGLRAAQKTSSTTPWGVAFLGESTSNGGGSTGNVMTGSWPGQIATALQAKYGKFAHGFAPDWNSHDTVAGLVPPPFTPSPDQDVFGSITVPAGLAHVHKMVTTSTLTLNTIVACPDFDIIYDNTVAGTWTYNVDAAGAQTVTPTGNSTTAALSRIQIRGLSTAVHSIVCGSQSVNNTMQIAGLVVYPSGAGASGCGVYFALKNGFDTGSYMSSPFGSGVPMRFSGQGGITGFPTQPALAVIAFGINDHPNHAPGRIRHFWGQMIKGFRSGYRNCSIILVTYPYPDTSYTGVVTSFGTFGSTYQNYIEAYKELARIHRCAHVNLADKWGPNALADGMFTSNVNPHPSAAGHNDIANTILPLVI